MDAQPIDATTTIAASKKEVPYEKRLTKMSDRQIVGELRRHNRRNEKPMLGGIFTTVLQIMMENHAKGMEPFINRSTRFKPLVVG